MAFDIPDFTLWQRERPVETRTYERFGAIAGGAVETLFDLPLHDIEIQRLEFSGNHITHTLRIYPYRADGTLGIQFHIADYAGTGLFPVQPVNLWTWTSDVLDLLVYDTVNNRYKMVLCRPIRFAHGVLVQVEAAGGVGLNINCLATIIDRGVIP